MVITSVYDRCGNHYCFPAGLLNQKRAGVGREGFISVRIGARKMKLSRATHCQEGGGSDGKTPSPAPELRDTEGHRDAGTVRDIWKVWMERHRVSRRDTGRQAGSRGMACFETEMVRYSGAQRCQTGPTAHLTSLHKIKKRHPLSTPHFTSPALTIHFLGRWGQPRCQVAMAPPAPSGICLVLLAPPAQGRLPATWK